MPRQGRTRPPAGEHALLSRLLPTLPAGGRGVVLGPGDDCAVLAPRGRLLLTIDALVEGVHFRRGWLTPAALGRKLFAINASDLAAMGGTPLWCALQIAAPRRVERDVAVISRAVGVAARGVGATLVGGNLSRAGELSATLTLIGAAPPHPVIRSGARAGDALYVTGRLGDAALGVRELRRRRDASSAAVRRWRAPQPRLAAGAILARRRLASAMIDVSDGLLQDLGHLCAASGVGARIELACVPCSPPVRRTDIALALAGGEDYELVFAVPPRREAALRRAAAGFGCPVTRIGECTRGRDVHVVDAHGRPLPLGAGGFDHFAS